MVYFKLGRKRGEEGFQPRPQGLLSFFQDGVCSRLFEKKRESPWDEAGKVGWKRLEGFR